MGLSYDLISEFVKITNDKKENTKEGTVYATVVSGTGGKYVRIDGSDLLTPMDTTTDIEDGERVTLMIKDHKAIVTGNVTTPSASTSKVDKVTESVNSVSDRVGTFELVVADKVSTNELEAYKATIEVLIANKATIEDLTATNAKIENLEVKNAEIENLVAGKATIEDLEAVNATIENLKVKDAEIENAVVENLKATTADIKILNADFAQIKTLVNGNLTSDNILSFNLTSEKVTVDDAFIKDAMIDTISAGKINAGEINTNLVSIGSEDGGMLITGSTQQFTDKNGNVRIQIGKDASGDFTFILYGENGQGQIINQNGITASAIGDGLIVNNMVSDNAAISGGKLDISSVITEINGDNSTTINSSKIYLNDQAQSLEVAFNSLKTQVDTIQEVTIKGDLTAIVEQVQSNTSKIEANKNSINTLISEDTVIKKQVTDLQGTLSETETTLNSKYTTLSQNLDGFKTTVADTYATKKSVTDVVDNIEANYSTTSVMNSAIEQKAQEISASVSSTYATETQVSTLDNNLKSNYSTTKQMESAISIAKQEINLGVSELYETKSEVTNKINGLSISSVNRVLGSEVSKSKTFTSADNETWEAYDISEDIRNKKVVIAFDYVATNVVKQSSHSIKFQSFFTTPSGSKSYYPSFDFNLADGNSSGTIISSPVTFGDIKAGTNAKFRFRFDKVSGTLEISKARVFIGTKDLGWSPAPEDIDNNIELAKTEAISSANDTLTSTISNYYTKKQTDSQINIAKEAIDLSVSNTYETKESVTTKVESTLDSAKSYADTKKTEAISAAADDATSKANTAKQEAIKSADKTLTSTIANYYTKKQTDSQINIAKEAIGLSVSNTYETKENVTTKINNIQVGSRNWIQYSSFPSTIQGWSGVNGSVWKITTSETFRGNNSIYANRSGLTSDDWAELLSNKINVNQGDKVVGSWYIKYRDCDQQSIVALWGYKSDGTGRKDISSSVGLLGTNANWTRYVLKGTVPADVAYVRLAISHKRNGIIYAAMPQLEFGDTATDWNPAPEDVNRNIDTAKSEAIDSASSDATSKVNDAKTELNASINKKANSSDVYTKSEVYTKKQTDSQINIAKEAIDLSVSTTYETKENVKTKVNDAKTELNTSINKKANSSDVYTKSEVYTKKQTDSQINIAKEAIDLSVSNTYETKTNVINKINGIEVGGRNLAEQTKSLSNVNGIGENVWTATETGNEGFKKLYIDTTSTSWIECQIPLYTEIYTITRKVTVSFEYQESTSGLLMFSFGAYGNSNNRLSEISNVTVSSAFKVISNIGGWKYVSYTFDPTSVNSAENATNYRIQFKKASGLTGKIHLRKPKIEFGTKPTSWSPAPEDISNDMESGFSSIKSETKSLKETVSSLSLGADSISASVKSLEETMTNTTNGLASDISNIQEQVNLKMSTDDVKLEIQKEMSKGANKVSTSTGFTFDENGLNISKTDSEMKTQITEDGMKIYKNDDIMLTANNQGVDAKNLHATTYLIIGGNSRMEDFTESGSKRTAVFWIG